jgi:transcriptional regulator with XRE-family HTH domain
MDPLNDFLGIDEQSPSQRRSSELIERNRQLLDDLIAIRKERKLSQADVAKVLGITQPSVADFERSGSDPKLSTIARYAHAVEALIRYDVEADTGQLFGSRWTQTASLLRIVDVSAGHRGGAVEVPANNKRTDFALGA